MASTIKRDLMELQNMCAQMDRLWRSVAVKGQRDLWKRKVEQVAEEVDSLKDSLDKYLQRHQRRIMEAKERAELLQRANGDSAHVLRIFDEEAQAMQSARNSAKMIDEAYATGVAILSQYSEQKDRQDNSKISLFCFESSKKGLGRTEHGWTLKFCSKAHREAPPR